MIGARFGIGQPTARLGALYAALFVVAGIQLPFWPVWLKALGGLDAAEISAVLAAGMLVRIVASPLIAYAADRRGARRWPILVLAGLSLALYASFAFQHGFAPILLTTLLVAAAFPSILPIVDSLTLHVCAERGRDYGRVRLWGSLAFIGAAYGGGALLDGFGAGAILWAIVAGCAGALVVAWLVPEIAAPAEPTQAAPIGWRAAIRLMTHPTFVLFLGSAGAIQASHGFYYAFGTLHWQHLGYDDRLIGALWGLGVVAEVLLFALSGRAVRLAGPVGLIALGGVGGVIRWTATAFDPPLGILAALQVLHALTYCATHLGSMHFIARAVPSGLSATAQSLLSALAAGVMLGGATWASGWLYATFGGRGYLAMTGLAGLGMLSAWLLSRRWHGGRLAA